MADTITIWDGSLPDPATPRSGQWMFWSRYAAPDGALSIPAHLDANGPRLRGKYLAFVRELGEQLVDGDSLIDRLRAADGMSLWWMSQLAEKSPFKSPDLYACLRLLALEELLVEARPKSVLVVSSNRHVLAAVASLCRNLEITVTRQTRPVPMRIPSANRIYQMLPWRLRGLLSARHILRRWSARTLRKVHWHTGGRATFLVSYFFNLGMVQANAGKFHSHQWESLPEHMLERGTKLNWLHHLLLTPAIKTVRKAVDTATGLNRGSQNQAVHSFVESFLGIRLIGDALIEWWRIGSIASRIRPRLSFCPRNSNADLWPFLQRDWETSFRGPAGLSNAIMRRLFDRCMSEVPRQPSGYYLWENQGWEAAFLNAWRRHGHGVLIGVQHATVAFWHLNNYDDPRIFDSLSGSMKPVPDYLAVNGPVARAMLRETGYPDDRLIDVEALRFQYLLDSCIRPTAQMQRSDGPVRLLFLGDFTREQTLSMGRCLKRALDETQAKIEITFKPHPACDVGLHELGGVAVAESRQPLFEILNNYHWAFSSNSSSAGLDAYLGGLKVAVFLDDASLNHSPLRGEPSVHFVYDHHALARMFNEHQVPAPCAPDKYFWLDPQLRRWSSVLDRHINSTIEACE